LLELDLSSEATVLPEVRDQVRDWAAGTGWSEHQIGEITLAVDEALSNVIRHGYHNQPNGKIHFECKMIDDAPSGRGLQVRIRDFCKNVDLSKICGRNLDDIRPGGLGVHLIKAMMEKVEYRYAPGGGVELTMQKSMNHVAQDASAADEDSGSDQQDGGA
jgi:anti-sigma regulatory factor (Ser/Thr protein kinase)